MIASFGLFLLSILMNAKKKKKKEVCVTRAKTWKQLNV